MEPGLRQGLLIAIVVSVLTVAFVEPLVHWFANTLMWIGSNYSEAFTRSVYSDAAIGLNEKFSFMLLTFALLFLAIAIPGSALGIFLGGRVERVARGQSKAMTRAMVVRLRWLSAIGVFIMFVLGSHLLTIFFIEFQLNASFNQRMAVLAARASDQDIKDLRASWALMQERSDYEHINQRIAKISAALSIKLPEPLWP
jgi:hypothetical protein